MATTSVIFVDIDGPLVPRRAQLLPENLAHRYGWKFDPCAVSMLNFLSWENPNLRAVISSHRLGMLSSTHNNRSTHNKQFWVDVFKENGIRLPIHSDWVTVRKDTVRPKIEEIKDWLQKHQEVKSFVTIDDEASGYDRFPTDLERRIFHICAESYDDGITFKDFRNMARFLGITDFENTLEKYHRVYSVLHMQEQKRKMK